jgi:hypothetical protein
MPPVEKFCIASAMRPAMWKLPPARVVDTQRDFPFTCFPALHGPEFLIATMSDSIFLVDTCRRSGRRGTHPATCASTSTRAGCCCQAIMAGRNLANVKKERTR